MKKDIDIIIPLLSIIILTIMLTKLLKPGVRNTVFIFLLSLICVYIPSSSMVRHIYYIPFISMLVILFLVMLMVSKLNNRIKIIIALGVLLVYNRPLSLTCKIIYTAIKVIKTKEKYPDSVLANNINDIFLSCGIKIRKNFRTLTETPTIFIANYCRDRVENAACILVPRNLSIMMQEGFSKINMSNIINRPIYVNGHGKGNFDIICEQVKEAHNEGNDIFVYINSPSYFNYMNKYSSGIYHIAKKLNITVTPLAIDYIDTKFGTIPNQKFYIESGDSFFVDNIKTAKYKTRNFHIKSHIKFKKRKYTA
jgi:hypothetical protein